MQDKRTPKAVRTALNGFESGDTSTDEIYDRAYNHVMTRIASQEHGRSLAMKVLMWVANVRKPLSVIQLKHALAINGDDDDDLEEDSLVDSTDIALYCSGLISIDKTTEIVRLVHITAQLYLTRNAAKLFPEASLQICRTCLSYILIQHRTYHSFPEQTAAMKFPLLQYAINNWGFHASQAQHEVTVLISDFFKAIPSCPYSFPERSTGRCWIQSRFLSAYSLHICAYFDLGIVVEHFIQNGWDINQLDSHQCTPLAWAASYGSENAAKVLLNQPHINVNARDDEDETALLKAAARGYDRVVQLILSSATTDVNVPDRNGRTPLSWAAGEGYEAIVKQLTQNARLTYAWRTNLVDPRISTL